MTFRSKQIVAPYANLFHLDQLMTTPYHDPVSYLIPHFSVFLHDKSSRKWVTSSVFPFLIAIFYLTKQIFQHRLSISLNPNRLKNIFVTTTAVTSNPIVWATIAPLWRCPQVAFFDPSSSLNRAPRDKIVIPD